MILNTKRDVNRPKVELTRYQNKAYNLKSSFSAVRGHVVTFNKRSLINSPPNLKHGHSNSSAIREPQPPNRTSSASLAGNEPNHQSSRGQRSGSREVSRQSSSVSASGGGGSKQRESSRNKRSSRSSAGNSSQQRSGGGGDNRRSGGGGGGGGSRSSNPNSGRPLSHHEDSTMMSANTAEYMENLEPCEF